MFKLTLFLINILIFTDSFGYGANILGIFPLPSKSHFIMFERLFKSLAARGHSVDIATHFPSKEILTNYTQLSLEGSLPIFVNNLTVTTFEHMTHYDLFHFMIKACGVDACAATLNTPALQQLKTANKKYDLVVTEIFGSDCMLGFGFLFDAPTISIISSINLPWGSDRVGNPDNPSYIPTYFSPVTAHMTFYERLENTAFLVASKILYYYWNLEGNRVAREYFGPSLPSLEELAFNTSLILVNSHYSINNARPTVPNFIEVGGLHIYEPKPLTKYFEDLLTTNNKGVIYLTMGSMILTESFEPKKLQRMFDAFAELPYKVLWKATKENFPQGLTIPKNIHFEKWMPQMDILCHPNVKLFVSHGGLMGTQEAVYCGVPRLGIPIFADQDHNLRVSEKLGLAIRVPYEDISKDTILGAAKRLLDDPVYKENVVKTSKIFKDRPISTLDTAIYWIEYVINHKGAPHLRSAAVYLPWYQYYLVDIGFVLIFVFCAIMYTLVIVKKLIFQFMPGNVKLKNE